jgi:integrase
VSVPPSAPSVPLRVGEAIDLYIGYLARRGRRTTTLSSYKRLLNGLADSTSKQYVHEFTLADYEHFLDRWTSAEPSTLASGVSLVRGFSRFLYERGAAATDVAYPLRRPPRRRPEDLDVTTVSASDVVRMLSSCLDWQEFLCVTTAIYVGARRAALAGIRRRDVDLVRGTVRLVEKGGKVATKPLPREYQQILVEAERDGLWSGPSDYLIPNRRPASVKREQRSDKVVWETVKRVARRGGVVAHVHALRAAFAVAFDDAHPEQIDTLKELLGHNRLETTMVYLRRKDRARAMEAVRDLSWGAQATPFVLSSRAEEAHTGFEPVPPP